MEQRIVLEVGEFKLREYHIEDEDKVAALFKLAFGKDLPLDIWRWKYVNNPFGYRILLCVDSADAFAAVMYAGAPYRANWNGRTVEVVQLMDIMSHPDYRKTGLFVKSADAYFERFAGGDSVLYYGIPSEQHFKIGEKYLEYSGLESGVAFLSGSTQALARNRRRFGGAVDVVDGPSSDFDRLWDGTREHFPFAVIRDVDFLEWRFFSHPTNDYTLLTYRSGFARRLLGYAVLGFEGMVGRIVDILMPPDSKKIADFISGLAEVAGAKGAERLETWFPATHFLTRFALAAGFEHLPEPLGIIPTARSFDEELTIPWVSENLYYTMADSDLF